MYVRMASGKVKAGTWDEYERLWKKNAAGEGGKVKGLKSRMLVRSTTNPDEGLSVSVWQDYQSCQAYENGDVYKKIYEQFKHLYVGQYEVKHYELRSP